MITVFDTNVLVAAVRSRRGASNALIIEALKRRVRWACSVPLFFEYEDALTRAELLLAVGASRQTMESFLTDIAAVIEPVALHFLWRPQLRDPQDEMVVETAANARADYLVTHNVTDFAAVRNRFTFDVVTPRELIARMKL
jgi:putative PIN family toxin of toxin-antitoxin system